MLLAVHLGVDTRLSSHIPSGDPVLPVVTHDDQGVLSKQQIILGLKMPPALLRE